MTARVRVDPCAWESFLLMKVDGSSADYCVDLCSSILLVFISYLDFNENYSQMASLLGPVLPLAVVL